MKSVLSVLLLLCLANESNSLARCCCCSKKLQEKCVICEEAPCQCEELASEGNNYKVSFRKLILLLLKKVNYKCSDSQVSQECKYCQIPCSKKHGIAKLLTGILKKVCTCEKEEEKIREIITKLLDPSECEKKPCQPHCDPQVQAVLQAILKKAVGCNCQDCPSNFPVDRFHCEDDEYKYWFKTSKDAMRKEISDRVKLQPKRSKQNCECFQPEETQGTSCQDVNNPKKYNKNKEVYKSASDNCTKCKTCQRPNSLICPRYISEDCRKRSKTDLFSICADCDNCRIHPGYQNSYVALFCNGCKPVDSPFLQFTRNGCPFKQEPERLSGIQVKTKYLQINDFRPREEKSFFNPFQPKPKGQRKKRARGCNKKKFK